jgi:uncharacterized protein
MSEPQASVNAEVISVFPNKVRISVDDLDSFKEAETSLRVGSYLKVSDNDNLALMCIIESFSIEVHENGNGNSKRSYIIDAFPLGTLKNGKFHRGGDELAIPPKKVVPASAKEVNAIFEEAFEKKNQFSFSSLSRHRDICVPVHGDKFFNKHIAIIGATGSGKSHTIASILQSAISAKETEYSGLNNSHIVIFDIHSEYKTAFPGANIIGVDDLTLPFWLLDSDEMEEMFLESGDNNNYNQQSLLRTIVTLCKEKSNPDMDKVFFDSPLPYKIQDLINCFTNLTRETKDAENSLHIKTSQEEKTLSTDDEKLLWYSEKPLDFSPLVRSQINRGAYADGSIDKFVHRLTSKINNPRLKFLFSSKAAGQTLEQVLQQFTGYIISKEANITILDLSGIPFEVLSITVSLITRILFDYSYFFRRNIGKSDTPLLLVFEEAHKYAPRSDMARYRASLTAIERVAKEGRKYGITLLIASQRPSEVSETIFSQCSNFVAMRLTNPDDQTYVKRLLPDTLGNLMMNLPSLEAGEALLMGEATVMPTVVYIKPCKPEPSSSDIPYLDIWKKEWEKVDFLGLANEWRK